MAWVYLDDQFPDHPKVVAAGDAAAWMFVCGLAYCRRYNTEGRIPKAQVPKLTGHRSPMKLAAALATAPVGYTTGLWEDRGDHYVIHDYHEWNKPQRSRSEAARKAAQTRWSKQAGNASEDANALPDAYETQSDSHALADASGCPPPLPPVVTSVDNSRRHVLPPVDDDHAQRIETTLKLLAQADLDERQRQDHLDPIGDPASWLLTAHDRRRASDGTRLAELAELDPDATPEQLAEALQSERTEPAAPGAVGANHTHDEVQEAMRALGESGMATVVELRERVADPALNMRGLDAARAARRGGAP